MSPEDVQKIRYEFGKVVGAHVSQDDLALVIGLTPNNGGERVREFEDGKRDTTGPVDRALGYLSQGLGALPQNRGVPEYVIGLRSPAADGNPPAQTWITRLWWPRFVGRVDIMPDGPKSTINTIGVDRVRWLSVVQWIDDPLLFKRTPNFFLAHAAAHIRAAQQCV